MYNEDYSSLIVYISNSISELQAGKTVKDFEHNVFQLALEAIYGKDCWDWFNKLNSSNVKNPIIPIEWKYADWNKTDVDIYIKETSETLDKIMVPGTKLILKDKSQLIVGDINTNLGTCDCCSKHDLSDIIGYTTP